MNNQIADHVARVLASPFGGHTDVWREQHDKTAKLSVEAFMAALQRPDFMALQGLSEPTLGLERQLHDAAERITKARAPLKQVKAAASLRVPSEYQLAFAYFVTVGLADEFLATCALLRIAPDWVAARNFYYARNVIGLHRSESAEKATVLEFGAGSGTLSILLWKLGLARQYIIVDLPEVLAFSATQVQKWVPDATIAFGRDSRADFNFISPDEIEALSDPVDVAINLISFAEMERRWVDAYFKLVYRLGKPGALFYNVNRTHQNLRQSDGSHFYSHPLLYPYRAEDDVLIWDVDPLQDHSRSWVNSRPANPAYARAVRIHGAGRRLLMPATALERHSLAAMQTAAVGWEAWRPA